MGEIRKLPKELGVTINIADQCMYGLKTRNKTKGKPRMHARKRTKFMTNSLHIAKELSTRCDGSHKHQHLIGGRAAEAAIYPDPLCRAICQGLISQNREDNQPQQIRHIMTVNAGDKIEDMKYEDENEKKRKGIEHEEIEMHGQSWDDLTGERLDAKEVRKARN